VIYLRSTLAGIGAVLIAGIASPFLIASYESLTLKGGSGSFYLGFPAKRVLLFVFLVIFLAGFAWEFFRSRSKQRHQ
jgi:hypothetical protein